MSATRNLFGALLLFAAIVTSLGTLGLITAALFFEQMPLLEQVYHAVPMRYAVFLMGLGLSWVFASTGKMIGGSK